MMKMSKHLFRTAAFLCVCLLAAMLLPTTASAIQRRPVNYTEDFSSDGFTDGLDIRDGSPLNQFWAVDQFVNADHSFFGYDENGKLVLNVQGYLGMLSSSEMFDTYTYETTLRVDPANSGSFMVSARHAGANPHGSLFEADHYKENNPDDPDKLILDRPSFLHDFSGFGVLPTATRNASGQCLIVLAVKTFVDDGHYYVANAYYDLYVDKDLTEYFTLRFDDNGETITVTLDGEPLCTVEMSDRGTYDAEASDTAEYFRRAVIRLPDGETALEVDNARLAVNARVSIASRCGKATIASLRVQSSSSEPQETEPAPATSAPADTAAEPTEADTEPATEPATEAETAPVTAAETQAGTEGETAPLSDAETETDAASGQGGTDLVLLCVFGGLELLLIAALAVLILGRK